MRDEITFPFPNFNGLTVEVWEVISFQTLLRMRLFIHAGINLNPGSKRRQSTGMVP